ncbi:MAG TPA: hypothetical protein VGB59_06455 [Allosphingosinicella sp.]|jgi:hypothetical protein
MSRLLLAAALAAQSPAEAPPELKPFLESCKAAGERLWGHSLCAPVVIVDPATGKHRTSQPAPPEPLPKMRANTAIKWGGEDWIMVLAPLPKGAAGLDMLFHEAWHVRQKSLGYPANASVAGHLDDPTNRYLMRLEWAALENALKTTGAVQRRHVAQALAFRRQRLARKEGAGASEAAQMRHEGMASYTGARLSGAPVQRALEALQGGAKRPSLGRSFAYVNGPAWGLLLDRYRPGWHKAGAAGDLPDLMPIQAAALARADDYGGTAVLAEETLSYVDRERRIRTAMAATTAANGLRLPLRQMSMDFDPNRVLSGPDGSSLYEKITLSDRWGKIAVNGTPLRMAPDFSAAYAPWPLPEGALELGVGWKVEERSGQPVLVEPGS